MKGEFMSELIPLNNIYSVEQGIRFYEKLEFKVEESHQEQDGSLSRAILTRGHKRLLLKRNEDVAGRPQVENCRLLETDGGNKFNYRVYMEIDSRFSLA